MNSITIRLLLAATLLMAMFIGITTLAIQHMVDQRARSALQERMQGQIYALLGVTEIDESGHIGIHASDLPNELMRQPASGTYAEVRDTEENQVWRSPSLAGSIPNSTDGAIGEWMFSKEKDPELGSIFINRFAVEWLLPDGATTAYQFVVADSSEDFDHQRNLFNRNLWLAMLTMGVLLLLSIAAALTWGLNPLRRIARQLNQIESGKRESLPVEVPDELYPLTSRINMLIASERGRQKRYRQTLDDLAHSLKTPLSVLRNTDTSNTSAAQEQIRQADRMEQIISYHIKRADAGSQRLLTAPISPADPANRIIKSLEKVYHQRAVKFENNIDARLQVRMEEGDLMEIYGNILENACKYGAQRITLQSQNQSGMAVITIDDDGPGFPEDAQARLLKRGERADTQIEGQGIGLAITRELIEGYGGSLAIANKATSNKAISNNSKSNNQHSGARVTIKLPAS